MMKCRKVIYLIWLKELDQRSNLLCITDIYCFYRKLILIRTKVGSAKTNNLIIVLLKQLIQQFTILPVTSNYDCFSDFNPTLVEITG